MSSNLIFITWIRFLALCPSATLRQNPIFGTTSLGGINYFDESRSLLALNRYCLRCFLIVQGQRDGVVWMHLQMDAGSLTVGIA